jgi:hypothetical protein
LLLERVEHQRRGDADRADDAATIASACGAASWRASVVPRPRRAAPAPRRQPRLERHQRA